MKIDFCLVWNALQSQYSFLDIEELVTTGEYLILPGLAPQKGFPKSHFGKVVWRNEAEYNGGEERGESTNIFLMPPMCL